MINQVSENIEYFIFLQHEMKKQTKDFEFEFELSKEKRIIDSSKHEVYFNNISEAVEVIGGFKEIEYKRKLTKEEAYSEILGQMIEAGNIPKNSGFYLYFYVN